MNELRAQAPQQLVQDALQDALLLPARQTLPHPSSRGRGGGGEGGVVSQLDEPHRKGGCKEELRAALSKRDRSC